MKPYGPGLVRRFLITDSVPLFIIGVQIFYFFMKRQWHPTPVLLPGKSHGWRSLVGCSPWAREESDATERLHFHFLLSCTGEGNGNPLQCSCLENPRDGEPGGLPSKGSHRVEYDWSDLAAAAATYSSHRKTIQGYHNLWWFNLFILVMFSLFSL